MPNQNTRDDSLLNTGMSSAVTRRRYEKQRELHDKKRAESEAARVSLTRVGSVVAEWIDKELKDLNDFSKMITEFDPESFMKTVPLAKRLNVSASELLQAQTLARMMHIEWLKKTKTKVNNTLKERKTDEPTEG